jgi:hypothetical protein
MPAPPPARPGPLPLLVFAQQTEARLDVEAWDAHASRFFSTGIRLASAEDSPNAEPRLRALGTARLVVTPPLGPPGVRAVRARPRSTADLEQARRAEELAGGAQGLVVLASRCPTVWLVERVDDLDASAWALAVALASVLLGPILDEQAPRLVGAKTGRAILEALARPVR